MVVLSDLQERHFLHVIKRFMRDLGYDSNFEKLKGGKREAKFVRLDLIREGKGMGSGQNLRYFQSTKPDPC